MIGAADFLDEVKNRGFELYTGVPCSYLRGFINYVIDSPSLRYVGAANEGDAVAIAAGATLGGRPAVCMFQNSGLGNAVSPLTSLTSTFDIPVLLIITHRGDPGGRADEPQHEMMGRITPDLLDLMDIPWERFPSTVEEIEPVLDRAQAWMTVRSRPYALVMPEGSVEPWPAPSPDVLASSHRSMVPAPADPVATRADMLQAVVAGSSENDLIVATTGYTGRQLYALRDSANQFYMVGSMGCASSFGLGLAIGQPDKRVIVVDGDGSALMRLGALSTVGAEQVPNLVHLLLDNGQHESTGGQETTSGTTDLAMVALGCGYQRVERTADPAELAKLLKSTSDGTTFVHLPIQAGIASSLPRPAVTPPQVAARLQTHLGFGPASCRSTLAGSPGAHRETSQSDRRLRILVVTEVFPDALDRLQAEHDVIQHIDPSREELLELIADREALVFRSGVQITAEVMSAAPGLELLIRAGSGLDNIDLDHVDREGIALTRVPEPGARAVAELGFAMMLALARQVLPADRLQREGRWAKHDIVGHLLRGKTLGVFGAGNIGALLGEMGAAWGMTVMGCVETPTPERWASLKARKIALAEPGEVVANADFLALTVPLTPGTRHLVGAETFAAMKPGSYVINLARGGVLDEEALLDALQQGHLAGAGLDVHEREGEGAISPLAALPNTILTPHIGAGTIDSQRMIGDRVLEIVADHLSDGL